MTNQSESMFTRIAREQATAWLDEFDTCTPARSQAMLDAWRSRPVRVWSNLLGFPLIGSPLIVLILLVMLGHPVTAVIAMIVSAPLAMTCTGALVAGHEKDRIIAAGVKERLR